MITYFCPNCWKDFGKDNPSICPKCGFNIKNFYQKDYTGKLINALNHPAGEIRHWAIAFLARKKAKRAVPYLEKIRQESKDPSLVRAAKDAVEKILKHV